MLWLSAAAFFFYLALLGAFFWFVTTQVFIVELNSGIWWFALLLYILVLILNLGVVFHPWRYSLYVRLLVLGSVIALTGAVAYLGVTFRPFRNVRLSDKIGALLFGGEGVDLDSLPPAKPELELPMPEALDQGRCNSCWAYAGAAAMSSMLYEAGRVELKECTSGQSIQDWVVSPQALIDLDTRGKCNGSYTPQAFRIAESYSLPTGRCVPGYSSTWRGSASDCTCNGPKTQHCLLSQTSAAQHQSCSNPEEPLVLNGSLRQRSSTRINGTVENMKKALSFYGPLIVWISFYREGYPGWTLYEKTFLGSGYKKINSNFIARPRDDPNYRVENDALGHALVLYGYGKNAEGVEYWIARNSWGKQWGYDGSVNIELGVNAWGIESDVYAMAP